MLFIISGSSGVGKNTVIGELLKKCGNLSFMPSVTTRPMREGERDGMPYKFVSRDDFRKMMENDEVFEYCEIHGHLYGTSRAVYSEMSGKGFDLIKDVDVNGTLALKKTLNDVVTIYLAVKSKEELRARLTARGEKDIELRLKRSDYEDAMMPGYDHVVVNDELNQTVSEILEIIDRERSKQTF